MGIEYNFLAVTLSPVQFSLLRQIKAHSPHTWGKNDRGGWAGYFIGLDLELDLEWKWEWDLELDMTSDKSL